MKAIVHTVYGPPDVLQLKDVPTPTPADDQVLTQVRAVSLNGSDREGLSGQPLYARLGGLRQPRHPIRGSDIAGRIVRVGRNIRDLQVGDDVFGELPGYHGGLAEYVCAPEQTLARKPAGMTYAEAAAIPQAGVIALRGIRTTGRVQPGQRVLINGAGGGAGTFAVQLAKAAGATVTAVDHPDKLTLLRALGADHVMDYTREDFTTTGHQYDLILDVIAHRSVVAYARALRPTGTYFFVGGAVTVLVQVLLLGPVMQRVTGKHLRLLVVPQNRADLLTIAALCEAGTVTPVIDRCYPLEEVPEALQYVGEGRQKGKVVITLA
jgi:NADPH:quinone reductase-like Zn-dependent oxidoreductase